MDMRLFDRQTNPFVHHCSQTHRIQAPLFDANLCAILAPAVQDPGSVQVPIHCLALCLGEGHVVRARLERRACMRLFARGISAEALSGANTPRDEASGHVRSSCREVLLVCPL